jgi:hypothetical protein
MSRIRNTAGQDPYPDCFGFLPGYGSLSAMAKKSWFCNEAIAIPNTANKDIRIRIRRIQTTVMGLAFICGTCGTVCRMPHKQASKLI